MRTATSHESMPSTCDHPACNAPMTSEPEPDIAVVPPGRYLDAHPREAWLVVEVAESCVLLELIAVRVK